ncbi:glycosyltransferase [Streptococcus caballi]|uniref:glycosyltransferase n=1 Tax=Streptococcus caballi TaxID=439220 RepID=UPI000374BA67|nr:glycosyltransferase [Streptococcus caballi]
MNKLKPRILMVGAENFGRGGRSVISWNLTLPLCESYKFDFLSRHTVRDSDYFDKVSDRGGDILELSTNNKIKKFFQLSSKVQKNRYDIVHINADNSIESVKLLLLFRLMGVKKFVIHAHSVKKDNSKLKNIVLKATQGLMNQFCIKKIACSPEAANYMFGNKNEVEIIENGIFLENYLFSEETRESYRQTLSISKYEVIGTIGRFSSEKNPYFIVDFIEYYSKINPNFKFLWIGEGEMLVSIKRELEARKLTKYVLLLGNRQDVNNLLMAMDLFILPSIFEGFGIVNIEAQVGGIPCLVSDAIPSMAKINPNFIRLPLDKGVKFWGDYVHSFPKERLKLNNLDIFKGLGFDIHQGAMKLDDQYKELLK